MRTVAHRREIEPGPGYAAEESLCPDVPPAAKTGVGVRQAQRPNSSANGLMRTGSPDRHRQPIPRLNDSYQETS